MNSLRFSADPRTVLIADASVVINLNATGRAADIIRAFPNRFAVTANACAELDDGAQHGHDDARHLHDLIAAGIVQRIEVGPRGAAIYEALIDGSARLTLDDGEAATIACAIELAGVALLDERKARSLCAGSFAALRLGSTAQLLMHDAVVAMLGAQAQVEALVMALKQGRMRVPPEYVAEVTALIGPKHAAGCASLPRAARVPDLG
jgi:predicted nucleic acid-binding protein